MRIYTEVNFQWDDKRDKLIEVSSEHSDYKGELMLFQGDDTPEEGERILIEGRRRTRENRSAKTHWAVWEYQNGRWVNQNEVYYDTDNLPPDLTVYATNDNPVFKQTEQDVLDEESYIEQIEQGDYDLNDDGKLDVLDIVLTPEEYKEEVVEAVETGLDLTMDDDATEELSSDDPLKQQTYEIAKSAIAESLKNWKAIVTEGEWDEFESTIGSLSTELGFAADDVRKAFEELPGAGEIIEEDWKFGLEGLEETRKEGLKGTITTREEKLEALRGEAGGEIRAAEAKIGAAGFASTGVGRTARDILAEEIGKEARDIDVVFTEGRTKAKSGFTTDEEALLTVKERAFESATDPWEDATTAYNQLSAQYEEAVGLQEKKAESALIDIQQDIMARILDIRGIEGGEFEDYNPFKAGAGLPDILGAAGEYGWIGTGFESEATEGLFAAFDPSTMMGQYKPYTPTDVQFYDPEYTLPWEEDDASGGGGEPDKPKGRR